MNEYLGLARVTNGCELGIRVLVTGHSLQDAFPHPCRPFTPGHADLQTCAS